MSLIKQAQAGTLESNDIVIMVAPSVGGGIVIELQSLVMPQYGQQIRNIIESTVKEQGVDDIYIKAVDRGALDCTIRARMLAALARAGATGKEENV